MADKVYFAENFRYLRKKKGLSQKALAAELGITRSRISSYEEGRSEPKLVDILHIGNYFGVPMEILVTMNLVGSRQEVKCETFKYIDPKRHN